MSQITTITFFRFAKFPDKLWGFSMMQFAHKHLRQVKGQSFYKLMGSGKGEGFNYWPDWSVYSLLQVWGREEDARQFFEQSALIKDYHTHSSEIWTIYMKSISTKGAWSGGNPFQPSLILDSENEFLVIITRATIQWKYLRSFWQYVPISYRTLKENPGLIYTKGIGEVPVMQMATFSLWKNRESLKAFAYQGKEHRGAIEKTRQLNWYKEELFSRFQPYLSVGTWGGRQLLPGLPVI
jgi:hypothetical protein